MNLTSREKDKLLVAMAAMVARNRLSRGVKLNHPEAVALITESGASYRRSYHAAVQPELLLELPDEDDSDVVADELLASDDFSDFSAGLSALPFALAAALDPLPERLSLR